MIKQKLSLINIIQLITFHEVNMVKWRTLDLVLEVVWPDRGRTASVRSDHLEYQVSGPSFYHVDLMESY